MSNYKAQATAQFVATDLAIRLGLATVVDLSGTDPLVTVGNATAGNAGATIKVLDQRAGNTTDPAWQALPGFGAVAQPVYTGTVIQLVVENISGVGAFPFTLANLNLTLGDLVRRGARVELWTVNSGQAPTFAGVGLALNSAFDPNLYYPLSDRV